MLLWPALWNGYPLVFADTGTYLSQAVEHYVGWDRPPFYSLFLLPLHLTITTWPVVATQALLAVYTLHLVRRTLLPETSDWWLVPIVAVLAITTPLPLFVSQIMPDIFTPLLVLTLALLVLAPERLSRSEQIWLVMCAAFMIAAHQSNPPLAVILVIVLLPMRFHSGYATTRGWTDVSRAAAPILLAGIALVSVNVAAFGRASLSPFGNVFLLARVIYDGPGMDVLRRDCPASGWRLCAYLDLFPPTPDEFLWNADGPVIRAGGAKRVSADATAIIVAALRAEPGIELHALFANFVQQLTRFASGDGLDAYPATVTPWIEGEFPRFEVDAYAASRQTEGTLAVPPWLQALHHGVALTGVVGCLALAFFSRSVTRGFATAVLLALLANAAITGGLSTPHDRYQSRVIWLPPLIAMLGLPSAVRMFRRRWSEITDSSKRAVPSTGMQSCRVCHRHCQSAINTVAGIGVSSEPSPATAITPSVRPAFMLEFGCTAKVVDAEPMPGTTGALRSDQHPALLPRAVVAAAHVEAGRLRHAPVRDSIRAPDQ